MDGAANDTSGHGLDGIVVNVTRTTDHRGNLDSAYHFTGNNSFIQLPVALENSFAVSIWMGNPIYTPCEHHSLLMGNGVNGVDLARELDPGHFYGLLCWLVEIEPMFGNYTTCNASNVLSPFPLISWRHAVLSIYQGIISFFSNCMHIESDLFENYVLNLKPNQNWMALILGTLSSAVVQSPVPLVLTLTTLLPAGAAEESADIDLSRGLTAFYPFNGVANDATGNNIDGVVHGAALTEDRFGKPSSAYKFSGDGQYINFGNGVAAANDIKTIAFWVKFDRFDLLMEIISKTADHSGVEVIVESNAIHFYVAGHLSVDPHISTSTNRFRTDVWYFIVATHEGEGGKPMKLYVDGSLKSSGQTSARITDSHNLLAGTWNSGGRFFRGCIDDIRIYDRAISAAEVDALYHMDELWASHLSQTLQYEANGGRVYIQDMSVYTSQASITVTLALSDQGAGQIETTKVSSDGVTPSFRNGVWQVSGAVADVNDLLHGLYFVPSHSFDDNFNIAVEVRDGTHTALHGNIAMTAGHGADLNRGLVAYYPFNGNADDVGENGNDGTVHGAKVAPDRYDHAKSAYEFDGSSYISAPAVGLPTGDSDRTLAMWVKIYSYYGSDEVCFGGYGITGRQNGVYVMGTVSSTHELYFSQWGQNMHSQVLDVSRWYFVVSTNIANSAALYLDGDLVASGPQTINTPSSGTSLFIGHLLGSAGERRKFNGVIDDVMVYNRALSGAEVQALYHWHDGFWADSVNQDLRYTEDQILSLRAIEIHALQPAERVNIRMVLSQANAGVLQSTVTSPDIHPSFINGVWALAGPVEEVNNILRGLQFMPVENYDLNFVIAVTACGTNSTEHASGTITMTAIPVDDPPYVIGQGIGLQSVRVGDEFHLDLTRFFGDVDDTHLTYNAKLGNYAVLPAWLGVDHQTGILSGVPPSHQNYHIIVTATDSHQESTSTGFNLVISPRPSQSTTGTSGSLPPSPHHHSDSAGSATKDFLMIALGLGSGAFICCLIVTAAACCGTVVVFWLRTRWQIGQKNDSEGNEMNEMMQRPMGDYVLLNSDERNSIYPQQVCSPVPSKKEFYA